MAASVSAYAGILTELAPALREVEEAIKAHLTTRVELVETINRYVIDSGGKRLRPLLMIISARLCGHRGGDFARLGTVIEYLHSATLLHDDVLDEAALRRGNPSANNRWGNTAAVLSGDFLFSQAFALLVEHYSRDITLLMCRTATDLIDGEVLELSWRRRPDMPREIYERIIGLKTASLIAASCKAGALLGGATPSKAEELYLFGHHLGMAFQIIDDILDFTGDQKKFGKLPGGDLREGTATLPFILLRDRVPSAERAWLRSLVERDDASQDDVARVVALLREHGADREAYSASEAYVREAREILKEFGDGTYRRMLDIAADYVVSRRV